MRSPLHAGKQQVMLPGAAPVHLSMSTLPLNSQPPSLQPPHPATHAGMVTDSPAVYRVLAMAPIGQDLPHRGYQIFEYHASEILSWNSHLQAHSRC